MKWSNLRHSIRLILFWGLTISWQNRLILCLGLDHFMTTQIDTMSDALPILKCSSPRNSISLFCHEIFKSQTYYQSVLAWNGQGLTILWYNRPTLCLGIDHFMKKTDWYYSGAWPFHDMKWSNLRHSISLFCHEIVKSQTYYQSVLSCVWGSTISWQHRLILCLRFDHFMT
jgi:hypothetical protein